MAGNLHSDPLGDPGSYHISDGGSAEVMKESSFETDLFAGGGPVVTYTLYSVAGLCPDKYPGKNGPALSLKARPTISDTQGYGVGQTCVFRGFA